MTHQRRYKFGFILSTSLGNLTRYQNFRKFAEQDSDVECVWAPVKHYIAQDEKDPFRLLPGFLRTRAIVLMQSLPVLRHFGSFDAVMIHMYEVDILTSLRSYVKKSPLRIISTDDAPVLDPENYPVHPRDLGKPQWKRSIRLWIDLWRAKRADGLIPFSDWAASILVDGAGVPRNRVTAIHVGLDLDLWRPAKKSVKAPTGKVKLLFVGGDFARKGGEQLLEAFRNEFATVAELHLVTHTAPDDLPEGVYVHSDMQPNDMRLRELYRAADIFVLPTTSDLSSWATLEAMASGCPVVATPVGGIVDLVVDGETGFLVPVGDARSLAGAIRPLIEDAGLRSRMGDAGRAHVEEHFDARKNTARILQIMKSAVDHRKTGAVSIESSAHRR